MIEPHKVTVVSISAIDLDARLWDAVRLGVADNAGPAVVTESTVFPVVARTGRLILLAGFASFLGLLNAGATQVSVWRAEVEDGEDLKYLAIAFAMSPDQERA
jgi:hypothetical protein